MKSMRLPALALAASLSGACYAPKVASRHAAQEDRKRDRINSRVEMTTNWEGCPDYIKYFLSDEDGESQQLDSFYINSDPGITGGFCQGHWLRESVGPEEEDLSQTTITQQTIVSSLSVYDATGLFTGKHKKALIDNRDFRAFRAEMVGALGQGYISGEIELRSAVKYNQPFQDNSLYKSARGGHDDVEGELTESIECGSSSYDLSWRQTSEPSTGESEQWLQKSRSSGYYPSITSLGNELTFDRTLPSAAVDGEVLEWLDEMPSESELQSLCDEVRDSYVTLISANMRQAVEAEDSDPNGRYRTFVATPEDRDMKITYRKY